jgi:hypothetical protein
MIGQFVIRVKLGLSKTKLDKFFAWIVKSEKFPNLLLRVNARIAQLEKNPTLLKQYV